MSKTILVALGSICLIALAGIVAMMATSPAPPPPAPEPPAAAAEKPRTASAEMERVAYEAEPVQSAAPAPALAPEQPGATSVYSQGETSSTERDRVVDTIFDAIATQSVSGVATVKPMLRSPDPEVRATAIEGMRQLGFPEAAAALREEAQRSTTRQEDREEMLEAAEFIDLPFLLRAQNTGSPR
jgi:hypothetical protein